MQAYHTSPPPPVKRAVPTCCVRWSTISTSMGRCKPGEAGEVPLHGPSLRARPCFRWSSGWSGAVPGPPTPASTLAADEAPPDKVATASADLFRSTSTLCSSSIREDTPLRCSSTTPMSIGDRLQVDRGVARENPLSCFFNVSSTRWWALYPSLEKPRIASAYLEVSDFTIHERETIDAGGEH